MFTDTDSLTYEIKSENVYEEFFKWKALFNFRSCPKDSKFLNETNKKVIGKNERWIWWSYCNWICWIKVKNVFNKKIDGKEHNTAKGVSIATEFDKFKDVLFNEKIIRHKMKRLQSKKHKWGAYEIDKISLWCFDDKRYVLDDRICTLAYFYKDNVTSCNKKEEIKKDCDNSKIDCDKSCFFVRVKFLNKEV